MRIYVTDVEQTATGLRVWFEDTVCTRSDPSTLTNMGVRVWRILSLYVPSNKVVVDTRPAAAYRCFLLTGIRQVNGLSGVGDFRRAMLKHASTDLRPTSSKHRVYAAAKLFDEPPQDRKGLISSAKDLARERDAGKVVHLEMLLGLALPVYFKGDSEKFKALVPLDLMQVYPVRRDPRRLKIRIACSEALAKKSPWDLIGELRQKARAALIF